MGIVANIIGAWNAVSNRVMMFLPNLMAAIVVFLLGWLVARVARTLIIKVLGALRFDVLTERAGINALLVKGNIQKQPKELLAILVYWFLMLIVIIAAFDVLGLPIIYNLLNKIVLYIPNIIAAVVVLIFGGILANFLETIVKAVSSGLGSETASLLSKIAKYSVVILAITMALQQLNIASSVVTVAFAILFGAFSLALALAFGLGGRDAAANYLQKMREARHK
ncbi:MAG: hypothetical protein K6U11_07775 [bacterium]|nr:hypothetical protein [bacterium]